MQKKIHHETKKCELQFPTLVWALRVSELLRIIECPLWREEVRDHQKHFRVSISGKPLEGISEVRQLIF